MTEARLLLLFSLVLGVIVLLELLGVINLGGK